MKLCYIAMFAFCFHLKASAQLSQCDSTEKARLMQLIKNSETDSLIFFPQLYKELDDSTITLIKVFGAHPIRYLKDFDYSKNIMDYVDVNKDSYGVILIKEKNKKKYVFAEIGCNTLKCEDLILPPVSERGFLDPVFESFKSLNNITIFRILLIGEWFVKAGDKLYVIDGNKLVDANAYMKCKYPLDVLKRRYGRVAK
jgi:hypothetical protein